MVIGRVFEFVLVLRTSVLSRLRHSHFVLHAFATAGRSSLAVGSIVVEVGKVTFPSSHNIIQTSIVVVSTSMNATYVRMLFL